MLGELTASRRNEACAITGRPVSKHLPPHMARIAPTPDQRHVLEHIARYRVTTVDALHAVRYALRTRAAATKATQRLVAAGLLQAFELRGRKFFQLTKSSAATVGAPSTAADPLQAQGLYEHYAVLAFCCLGSVRRERLTTSEFREAFPEFANASGISPSHQHYYLDTDHGVHRLGRATVDAGGDARRLLGKCREIVRHATETPHLRDVLRSGLFVLTILTPEEQKKAVLLDAMLSEPLGCFARVEVVPELHHVL